MADPFYKSPRLFSTIFILSLPMSYFSIWFGAVIKSGSLSVWTEPFLVYRLLSYAIILLLGMFMFRHFMFGRGTSMLKVVLTAFFAPLVLFMVMAVFDSVLFSILDSGLFSSYLPERVLLYTARFYTIGLSATLIAGLMYHLSFEAKSQREMSLTFS